MIQKLKPEKTKPHEYQDRVYGQGVRVLNPIKTGKDMPPKFRDTVTGNIVDKADFDR